MQLTGTAYEERERSQYKWKQEEGQRSQECLVGRTVEQENIGHEEKHEIDGRTSGMSLAEEERT